MSRALVSVRIIASSLNKDLDSPQDERGLQPLLRRPLPFALRAAPRGCSSKSFPHLRRAQGSPPYPHSRACVLWTETATPWSLKAWRSRAVFAAQTRGGAKSQKRKARIHSFCDFGLQFQQGNRLGLSSVAPVTHRVEEPWPCRNSASPLGRPAEDPAPFSPTSPS